MSESIVKSYKGRSSVLQSRRGNKAFWRQQEEHAPQYVPKIYTPEELPIGNPDSPSISLLWGTRGTGKTLNMTALGWIMQQKYHAAGQKTKVLTNYHCGYADYSSPFLVEELMGFDDRVNNSIVLFDELSANFHNRRSQARTAVDMSAFLTQIRKRDIEMIFTTQTPTQVDIQVIWQINFFIQPKRIYLPGAPGWHTDLYIYDHWGHVTGRYYTREGRSKRWPPDESEVDWIRPIYFVNSMFNQYNTKEVIAPIWNARRKEILSNQNWTRDEMQQQLGRPSSDAKQEVPQEDLALMPIGKPKAPKTFDEYLELVKSSGDHIGMTALLQQAKILSPDLKTQKAVADYLTSNGWHARLSKGRKVWGWSG